MRKTLALLALLVSGAVFAGCLDSESATPDADDGADAGAAVGMAPAVDVVPLLGDLRAFAEGNPSRADNHPDHEAARQFLAAKFEAHGLEVYRQEFYQGIPQANIVGIKWGEVREEWVVVGGHYDIVRMPSCPDGLTCPTGTTSQGMYDDGSGTIMTLHLAKAFASIPTKYTIAFVGFDGEERGLQGSGNFSETFAAGLTPYGPITYRAMLDLDMFGLNWPGVDAPVYFDSNSPALEDEVRSLAGAAGFPEGMVKYQGITLGRSDYAHFMDLGVPTGFFISSFEEYQAPADVPLPGQQPAPGLDAYPFWHTQDTWETMVLMAGSEADVAAGFQSGVDLASGVLWRMAQAGDLPVTE
jgi:Zn-dependent M28 family amino/carboxypeptidase